MKFASVKLKRNWYKESTLVDKVCTNAQKRAYHKKEKFVNSKHKELFLAALSRYCTYEFDADTQKYKINQIFKSPRIDKTNKLTTGVFQYLSPIVLNEIMLNKELDKGFTALELAYKIKLVNKRYGGLRNHQKKTSKALGISEIIVSEYFNKVDDYINYYLRKCLTYLAEMGCFRFEEGHIIKRPSNFVRIVGNDILVENELRMATRQEVDLYHELAKQAADRAGVKTEKEKWYSKNSLRYRDGLSKLLLEHNILAIFKGIQIMDVDEARCAEIMELFNWNADYKKKMIDAFCEIINKNATSRYEKKENLDEDYLLQYQKLTELIFKDGGSEIYSIWNTAVPKKVNGSGKYNLNVVVRRNRRTS